MNEGVVNSAASNKSNMIVFTGVWLCIATIVMIVVLHVSARRIPSPIPQTAVPTEIKIQKSNSHYSKYVHAGYTTALR